MFLSLIVLKQKICIMALEVDPWLLNDIPDYLINTHKKMCDEAVRSDSYSLQFDPDWFVTQEQIKNLG